MKNFKSSSFLKMTSQGKQLVFNSDFIFSSIDEWKKAAEKYDEEAQKHYKKIRSYLTLWQFRLNDDQKCDIRERLAQHLDEITDHDFVHDLDSYLEGFCFQLDKSVLPVKPKEVKIEIAKESPVKPSVLEPNFPQPVHDFPNTTDDTEFDYYTMQFFQ